MSKVGTMEEMLADEKSGVKAFTKDGKCSNCGNCCANFLPVSDVEIERIRWYVKKHDIKEQIRRFPTAVPMVDMMCPFRDDIGKKCTIYEVRPAICRDFQCDKQEHELKLNKALYHGKYGVADMRYVFYGRENGLLKMMKEFWNGNK